MSNLLLIFFTASEILLLAIVLFFFLRLRKSEELVSELQAKQEDFVRRLQFNTQLESELVATFEQRQNELLSINEELESKAEELRKLVKLAGEYCKSPQMMREIILNGHRSGKSTMQLAKATGLSSEEVELIIDRA
ncbi:hypothetical protein [Pseudodesulfovibrio tunisiensis]|uniref:hypothetical protein n=1 Tax=Pseudodesulfovibrio tunisiensis TaxID=463192 RepID=UPI001FB551BC|nr:hypothetical protein [Pseudodesulfovibrio tunisiensis]